VAPAVVARIEAGLTVPGGRLHGVRAVHAARNRWLGFFATDEWYIAAEVQVHARDTDEGNIAVWRLSTRGDPRTGEGAPEAAIATVVSDYARRNVDAGAAFATGNGLAYNVSNFPLGSPMDRPDLKNAAYACVAPPARTATAPPAPPAPPKLVCHPVESAVVARIEAALTVPGTKLRGVRAARSATDPQSWVVAADLEGVGRYEGDDGIGVWTVRWDGPTPPATPEAPASIAAVNGLAAQAGPFPRSAAERRLVTAAVGCANEALGGG
jgi:hypothetical protein